MKQWIPYAVALAALVVTVVLLGVYFYGPVTTVIIARHAERLNDSDTTSLSPEGRARAEDLARLVRDAGVVRLYVSDKVRTRQTAEPAAALLGLAPVIVPEGDARGLIDSLLSRSGETALVIAHANTIPAILTGLHIHHRVTIARGVFDDLFVVTLSPSRASLLTLKYGRPS